MRSYFFKWKHPKGNNMNNTELFNKTTEFLRRMNAEFKGRSRRITPKEISYEIKGAYTSIGKIAKDICLELNLHGVNIKYIKKGNKRYFEFF